MDRLDAIVQELRSVATPTPPQTRHRQRVPRALIALPIGAVGVILAVVLGHRAPAETAPTARATTVQQVGHWQAVLERIDANRMQAFMDDDPSYIVLNDEWNGPVRKRDQDILTALRNRGLRLDRNPLHIDSVSEEFVAFAGDLKRVGLRVTDHLDAHNYVDKQGRIVESRPGRGSRTWSIELRRSAATGAWRLFKAVPATTQSPASSDR